MAIFSCADCGYSQKTDDKNIGKNATCPKCKKSGRVEPDQDISANEPISTLFNAAPITPPLPVAPPIPRPPSSPQPLVQAAPNKLRFWLTLLVAATFTACAVIVAAGAVLFFVSLSAAESAPQEGAVGAVFGAGFVAIYVFARSVEKVLGAISASVRTD